MAYRVIQWATGNVGKAAIAGILAHPELELVGAWVHGAAKDGVDVGEICGIDEVGVRATRDSDALLALGADCIVYSPILAQSADVVRMLEAGINVVTPLGWVFPSADRDVAAVEAACAKGGATLHGTGIHPGGITERFPLVFSALCRNVRHVRAEEFSDIRTYPAEFVVKEIMLFGKPPEVAEKSSMPEMMARGFGESIDMLAAKLGIELDPGKRTHHEMALATAPIETPVGTLQPGTVAGQRFTWQGTRRGEPVITVRTNWLMGEENLEPAWTLGEERFEVELDADPPLKATFHGLHPADGIPAPGHNPGIVATAMHCVNSIPAVCRAEPGIKTYLDLPLIAGRFARSLAD